jgi:hypothetical protein
VVGRSKDSGASPDLVFDSFLVGTHRPMTYTRMIRMSFATVSHLGDVTSSQQSSHSREISSWLDSMDPPALHPDTPRAARSRSRHIAVSVGRAPTPGRGRQDLWSCEVELSPEVAIRLDRAC